MSANPGDFIHLHNHTEYSLLDGLIPLTQDKDKPSKFLQDLARRGVRGLAITDHGNMFGAVEFYLRCRKAGLKPIVGCEFYAAKGERTDRSGSQKDNRHLSVLARNFEGYQNLLALSSKAFLEGFYYDPRIDFDLLAGHARGLIVLSGCLKGELARTLLEGDLKAAVKLADKYKHSLDEGCFFLEMMDHGIKEQRQVISGLLEVHAKTGIPLVATNDCHYPAREDAVAQDAGLCISTGRRLDEVDRLRFSSHEFYFKSAVEMAKVFHFHPDALSNTLRIADMCALDIPMDKMHLPDFPVPEGHTQDSYLERICGEGLVRLGVSGDETYASRLKFELSVIRKMGFSGYFLIVWDFIRYAKLNGVPVGPGRGSGAGSLVSYSLDITTVDPIRHRLLFERFLNPDRKSMPDLDIDFSDSGREKVIEYVRGKYGAENVAQIISFNSMGARGVLKDVGRVMGMPIPEVERLTKMIPGKPNITLAEALKESPDLSAAAKEPAAHKLISLARRLEGLKRNTSVHAAGIVISKDVVWKYAPLARTGKGIVTTQYDGDILPQLGLLKMDFLGLRNLSVITLAVDLIRSRGRPDFDVGNLPMDDKKTYEILASGRALGVFQLDSEGIRELLRRLKPTNFEDISAVIALYRPGPMQSGMLDLFVERKHGKKVKVDHPRMEPVLRDTYGCIVYQEQVMELAKSLAGFTPGEADGLRKAMGKKIPEEMDKLRGKFVAGCARNAIPEKLAGKVYDQIEKFGGYGFNKSHTVAYGTISYQTAYLKANHTLEYFTALLTSEIGHSAINVEDKENKLVTYIDDARSFGIEVLGPDASASQAAFSIEGNAIRFGLLAVKHVGQGAAAAVVAARGSSPFASLDDFCRRVDLHAVNRKAVESLIMAGAMDSLLGGTPIAEARARLTAQVEPAMARQAKAKEDLARGQGSLFDEAALAPRPAACEAPPWREHELLQREKDVLGFYLSGHPLVRYKDMLACTATRSIAQLSPQVSGPVRVSGLVLSVKKVTTKKGDPMARAVIEDLSGEIPAILFPKAFKDLAGVFKPNAILTVAGTLNWRGEGKGEGSPQSPELFVEDACPVEAAMGRYAKALSLRFSTSGLEQRFLEELRDILRQYPGPTPVSLKLETPAHGETVVETDERVALCGGLLEGLSRKLGEKAWVIESASS